MEPGKPMLFFKQTGKICLERVEKTENGTGCIDGCCPCPERFRSLLGPPAEVWEDERLFPKSQDVQNSFFVAKPRNFSRRLNGVQHGSITERNTDPRIHPEVIILKSLGRKCKTFKTSLFRLKVFDKTNVLNRKRQLARSGRVESWFIGSHLDGRGGSKVSIIRALLHGIDGAHATVTLQTLAILPKRLLDPWEVRRRGKSQKEIYLIIYKCLILYLL